MKKTTITATLFLVIFFLTSGISSNAQGNDWITWYEKSEYKETPRYDETIEYCKRLADQSPIIQYEVFGLSPQNRDIPVLIMNSNQQFTPDEVQKSGQAVVMIQACIHPGESEGKDAGLMLLRDIAIHNQYPGLLKNTTVLFIPIFNTDGHERWSKYSRINQNGPEEMGWRVTAQNLNLNRDYMKSEAPEMKAWLNLFHNWMPDFFIDCHTTDGADYQYVLTYAMEVYGNMDKGLTAWQKEQFIPAMEKKMFAENFPVFPYVQFRSWHDPKSGLRSGVSTPMISQGYTALLNRPGLLIETHMLKPYKPRVESTYELLRFSIEYVNKNHHQLKRLIAMADNNSTGLNSGDKLFPVNYTISKKDSVLVEFLGIDYEIEKSDLTGYNWYKYGSNPATFNLPLFNTSVPTAEVDLPLAYIIPAQWIEIINIIKNHHIEYYQLADDTTLLIESYLFSDIKFNERSYEGRHKVTVKTIKDISETRLFCKGSIIVPGTQSRARLIAYLLEPRADNSLLSWGYFNAIFEQKEYAETYVIEKMARQMIRENPELLAEFEKKKSNDPDFSKNQWTMTNWFYQKTPYWDERLNRYPGGKIN